MTPQERQLVAELFDRLASLERGPRDPDAERAIAEGFGRAPNAAYALVQTVLVQDEALKRANARIEELEATPAGETPRQGGGFLDSMRGALLGRDAQAGRDAPAGRDASPWRDAGRGSVPSVRPGGLGTSGVWGPMTGAQPMTGPSTMDPSSMNPSPMGAGTTGFGGGSFLGTAAASAAGVIGGAMMLNGIRSMFGHSASGASALGAGAAGSAPWGGSAANSDLARQAGIDHIGGDKSGATDPGERHAGLLDTDQDDHDNDDDIDVAGDLDGGDSDTV